MIINGGKNYSSILNLYSSSSKYNYVQRQFERWMCATSGVHHEKNQCNEIDFSFDAFQPKLSFTSVKQKRSFATS